HRPGRYPDWRSEIWLVGSDRRTSRPRAGERRARFEETADDAPPSFPARRAERLARTWDRKRHWNVGFPTTSCSRRSTRTVLGAHENRSSTWIHRDAVVLRDSSAILASAHQYVTMFERISRP